MQEIRKIKEGKETYMQDVPKATNRDSTSVDSIQSVIKISERCRTPIKGGNLTQVTKVTEKCNADLVTSDIMQICIAI